MTPLDYHLGLLYRADKLGQGDWATVARKGQEAVAADADLRKAVEAKIKELEPVVRQRGKNSAVVEQAQFDYCKLLLEPIKENI